MKRGSKPRATETKRAEHDVVALLAVYHANPFHLFWQGEVRAIFGLGEDSMMALIGMGAPTVAKKINLDHFKLWLWESREKIGKLT